MRDMIFINGAIFIVAMMFLAVELITVAVETVRMIRDIRRKRNED
jgi:hypothetical protein